MAKARDQGKRSDGWLSDIVSGDAVQLTPNGIARAQGKPPESTQEGSDYSKVPAEFWGGNRTGE